jgi:hypothetical protein
VVSFRDLLLVNRLRSGLPVNQRAPSLDRRRTTDWDLVYLSINVLHRWIGGGRMWSPCVNDLFGSVVVCFVCLVTWYWARRASGYLLTGLVWVSARFAPDCVCESINCFTSQSGSRSISPLKPSFLFDSPPPPGAEKRSKAAGVDLFDSPPPSGSPPPQRRGIDGIDVQ